MELFPVVLQSDSSLSGQDFASIPALHEQSGKAVEADFEGQPSQGVTGETGKEGEGKPFQEVLRGLFMSPFQAGDSDSGDEKSIQKGEVESEVEALITDLSKDIAEQQTHVAALTMTEQTEYSVNAAETKVEGTTLSNSQPGLNRPLSALDFDGIDPNTRIEPIKDEQPVKTISSVKNEGAETGRIDSKTPLPGSATERNLRVSLKNSPVDDIDIITTPGKEVKGTRGDLTNDSLETHLKADEDSGAGSKIDSEGDLFKNSSSNDDLQKRQSFNNRLDPANLSSTVKTEETGMPEPARMVIDRNGLQQPVDILNEAGEVLPGNTTEKLADVQSASVREVKSPTLPPEFEKNLVDQMTDGMRFSIRKGGGGVRMSLYPESLGEMRIELSVEDGVVKAKFLVDNMLVKDVVESNFLKLKNSLENYGLKMDSFSVSVGHQDKGSELEQSAFVPVEEMEEGFAEPVTSGKPEDTPNLSEKGVISLFA